MSANAGLRTWWGKRWAEAVSLAAPEPKPRGRFRPRGARLRGLDAKTGEASIEVQTASVLPYEVRISIAPIADETWAIAREALGSRALFAAKLLAGEMPREVEDAVQAVGASLFPGPGEVRVRCNCPAGSGGCRHGNLAERTLAEAIDHDPFLLFDLRGRPRAEVLGALGVRTAPAAVAAGDASATTSEEAPAEEAPVAPADFRRARGDLLDLHFHIAEPDSPRVLLVRLGDPPGWAGPPSLLEALGPHVENAAAKARDLALADPEEAAAGPGRGLGG